MSHGAEEGQRENAGGMADSESRDIELSSHIIVPHRRAGTLSSHTDVPNIFRPEMNQHKRDQLPHCVDTDTCFTGGMLKEHAAYLT